MIPAEACGECEDGLVWMYDLCNCDTGPEGQHHPMCGAQPCPNDCWDRLHPAYMRYTA